MQVNLRIIIYKIVTKRNFFSKKIVVVVVVPIKLFKTKIKTTS
jgi:hypothetical protein